MNNSEPKQQSIENVLRDLLGGVRTEGVELRRQAHHLAEIVRGPELAVKNATNMPGRPDAPVNLRRMRLGTIDDSRLALARAVAVLSGESVIDLTPPAPPKIDLAIRELKMCEWCPRIFVRVRGSELVHCDECRRTARARARAERRQILRHFSAGGEGSSSGYRQSRARHKRGDTIDAGWRPPAKRKRKVNA